MSNLNNDTKPDIKALQKDLAESFIHYDPERVDYTISDLELEQLSGYTQEFDKDVCLTSVGLAVPFLINGFIDYAKIGSKDPTPGGVLANLVFGGASLAVFILFAIRWSKTTKQKKAIINRIKAKPKYKMGG